MNDTQNDQSEKTYKIIYVDFEEDGKEKISTLSYTFDDLFSRVKKVDPDFPEEIYRIFFDFSVAAQNGELTYEDLMPGGRFSNKVMDPVMQAVTILNLKDELNRQKHKMETSRSADKSKQNSKKSPFEDINVAETVACFKEINPEFNADDFTLMMNFWKAQSQNELKPEDSLPGGRFEEKKLFAAAKALYITLFGKDEFDKNKDRLTLKDLTNLIVL